MTDKLEREVINVLLGHDEGSAEADTIVLDLVAHFLVALDDTTPAIASRIREQYDGWNEWARERLVRCRLAE